MNNYFTENEFSVLESINDKLEYLIETNADVRLSEDGRRIGNNFDSGIIGIFVDATRKLHSLEIDLMNIEDLLRNNIAREEFKRLYIIDSIENSINHNRKFRNE